MPVAPLGTDEEAAGTPVSEQAVMTAWAAETTPLLKTAPRPSQGNGLLPILFMAAAAVIVCFAVVVAFH